MKTVYLFSLIFLLFAQISLAQKFEWVKKSNLPNYDIINDFSYSNGTKIVKDNFGNIYIAGYYAGVFNYGNFTTSIHTAYWGSFYIAKMTQQGEMIWIKEIQIKYYSRLYDFKIDKFNNLYFLFGGTEEIKLSNGEFFSTPNANTNISFLVKFDSNGDIIWHKNFANLSNDKELFFTSISPMSNGEIAVSGVFFGNFEFEGQNWTSNAGLYPNNFVAKFDANGTLVWKDGFRLAYIIIGNGFYDRFPVVASDSQGNIFVGGSCYSPTFISNGQSYYQTSNDSNFTLAKWNPQGQIQWVKTIPHIGEFINTFAFIYNIEIDNADNVLVAGAFSGNIQVDGEVFSSWLQPDYIDYSDNYILKLDNVTGDKIWFKQIHSHDAFYNYAIHLDEDNSIYSIGSMRTYDVHYPYLNDTTIIDGFKIAPKGSENVFIFKLDSNGLLDWTLSTQSKNDTADWQDGRDIINFGKTLFATGTIHKYGKFGCIEVEEEGFNLFLTKITQDHFVKNVITDAYCEVSQNRIITITPFAEATKYYWSLPSGITGAYETATNQLPIFVSDTAQSGKVQVWAYNACDEPVGKAIINLTVGLPKIPTKPKGDTLFCALNQNIIYHINPIIGAIEYEWQMPSGFLSNTGNFLTNTSTIEVKITSQALTGNIRVRARNICGWGEWSPNLSINIKPLPSKILEITGKNFVCLSENNIQYNAPITPNALQYVWTLPNGVSIVSGNNTTNTPQITLNFATNFTGGILKVKGWNECGFGEEASLQLQTTPALQNPSTIQGKTQLCQGAQNEPFSINAIDNATEYIWTLPNGVIATTGTHITSLPQINLNFASSVSQGEIKVKAKNNCPNSETLNSPTFNFTVIQPPTKAGNIQGNIEFCINTNNQAFEILPINGTTEYIWEVPNGVQIIEGQNTPQIKVNFTDDAESGFFRVKAKNQCFTGEPSEKFLVTITQSAPKKPEITLDCDILKANENENYLWFRNGLPLPDSTRQNLLLNEAGEYFVRVKNICGFADSEKFNFIENTCETTFYLPTAFSPNDDGLNDNLEIFGRNFTKLNLKIFNRWGELIFIARNQTEQWNGTLNGSPIPEGVYAWVADYESTVNKYKGQKFQKRGSLTVVR